MFVLGKPFHPTVMCVNKTIRYKIEAPFKLFHSIVGSMSNPQTLVQAGKACQEQTHKFIMIKRFTKLGLG